MPSKMPVLIAAFLVVAAVAINAQVDKGESANPLESSSLVASHMKVQRQSRNCQKVPGAGLGAIKPFKSAYKDGFLRNPACYKDGLFHFGDKFGKNKHDYKLGQVSNVSIVHYNAHVKKEDRKAMSPDVCFEFCRTVPDMLGFGLVHGRDCYCAPYFERVAGDSSACDEVCEGAPTQVCGGPTKSSIFTMHMCYDGGSGLQDAVSVAEAGYETLLMQSGRLEYLADSMQEQASSLQKTLGSQGNPQASNLMQDAKVWAGEALDAVRSASKVTLAMKDKISAGIDLLGTKSNGSDYIAAKAMEVASAELAVATKNGKAEFDALLNLQHLMSPRTRGVHGLPTYWKIMHYVDKARTDNPSTCSGTSVGKPIVGKSYHECANHCDSLMDKCVGFTFFPSRLCFLLTEVKEVVYYTGCADPTNSSRQGAKTQGGFTGAEQNSPVATEFNRVMCSVKFSEFVPGDLVASKRHLKSAFLATSQKSLVPVYSKAVKQCKACPIYNYEGQEFTHEFGAPTLLTAKRFAEGTFIIDTPGVYTLLEDITFDPKTPLSSGVSDADVSFPDPLSEKYPQLGGYFLGFFAAIAVTADNVTIDCKGKTIQMSEDFHKRQRFFANIELGSRPFIPGAGPPQFGNKLLTVPDIVTPNNVRIQNCKLGRSSHHGIHGNNNKGVYLEGLEIDNFEVGGIAFNGATDVHIKDVKVSNSLQKTFHAQLSQANFIDHMMNTLLPTIDADMNVERNNAMVTLRGKEHSVSEIFQKLHNSLNTYYDTNSGPLEPVFGNGQQLPDGSAIYGIVLHKTGPVVDVFGACPESTAEAAGQQIGDITLTDVSINNLKLDTVQMTRLILEGNQVMGPAGDVFDWTAATNGGKADGKYVGNILTDAQLAVGAFKKYLQSSGTVDPAVITYFFGATHIPDPVLTWASEDKAWSGGEFKCNGDAMSHMNKGAVGLFLNHVKAGAVLGGVSVNGIGNTGAVDSPSGTCKQPNYQGGDVRGVAIVNSPGITKGMLDTDILVGASLTSKTGKTFAKWTHNT